MKIQSTFSELLQAYFTEYLMQERNASPHTIANYRDTFRMVIAFAQERWNKPPTKLAIADLDAPFVAGFLDHLERIVASVHAAAMCVWRQSIRSSITWRSRNRPPALSLNVSWPSKVNGAPKSLWSF